MKPLLNNQKSSITFFMFLFIFCFSCFFKSCKKDLSYFIEPDIEFTTEAIGVTEVWLNLKVTPNTTETKVIVKRDTVIIFSGGIDSTNTTIYDKDLLPAKEYKYNAHIVRNNAITGTESEINITTMDTTSHNIEWEIIEFSGTKAYRLLRDVWIINEKNIWLVGELYTDDMFDSTGNWLRFNAVHWDGQQWIFKRLSNIYHGYVVCPPLNSIHYFSDDAIWLSAGIPIFSNTQNGKCYHLWDLHVFDNNDKSVNHLWGDTPKTMYFVGDSGTAVYYDGNIDYHYPRWKKYPKITDLNFVDIYGSMNSFKGSIELLTLASKAFYTNRAEIYMLNKEKMTNVSTIDMDMALRGLWFKPGIKYYVAGVNIFETHDLEKGNWKKCSVQPKFGIRSIRGNDINDIVAVGGTGEVLHYNGMTWKSYYPKTSINGVLNTVEMKDDLIVAVGDGSRSAYVLIGRKN